MANPPVRRTSGMAVAALVCGICGLVIPYLGFLLALLGIIFGGVAMGQTGREPNLGGRGMAIAGLVCGIVGIVLWIIILAAIGWKLGYSSPWGH
jgi:hypothetical protein